MEVINLAIADDHRIFREGLKSTLEDCEHLKIIIEANNGIELIHQLSTKTPDVILMDIKMPEMDGMQTTRLINQNFPHIKILALSMHNEDKYIVDMMKAGANGYIIKNAEPQEIIKAISIVHSKGYYFNEFLSVTLVKQLLGTGNHINIASPGTIELQEREIEVLKLICEEFTNVEIADKLFLSVRTVEGYRTRLLEKTGAKNIAGLVMYAIKNKIIKVDE